MKKARTATFNHRDYAPGDRLRAFIETTSSIYDAQALGDEKDFVAEVLGYQVGDLLFNDLRCSAMRFHRSDRHLRGNHQDFLVLHAQLSGEELVQMQHGILRLLPGNLYLRDWAYPFDSQATRMHIHSVVIPRQCLASSNIFNVHNPVLSWPMSEPKGQLLWELWSRLFEQVPFLDLGTAEVLSRGLMGFLDGLIGGDQQHSVNRQPTLQAMEHYLQSQLRGDVRVEDLCRHFHVSRATVFRLFKSHGGLKHYLDRMRLERCFSELRSADPRRTGVGEVAAGWGYGDPTNFNRRFRAQFGVPPSKVLGSAVDPKHAPGDSQSDIEGVEFYRTFKRWLQEVAGAARPKD